MILKPFNKLQDKMEVMIMVSGWMEEDEDDKRTFGVVPEHMGLQERLTRFYRIHDTSRLVGISSYDSASIYKTSLYWCVAHDYRLGKAANEAKCFEVDPAALFEQVHYVSYVDLRIMLLILLVLLTLQLKHQYGSDPTARENLVPPVLAPPTYKKGDTVSNVYYDLVEECFAHLAESRKKSEAKGPTTTTGSKDAIRVQAHSVTVYKGGSAEEDLPVAAPVQVADEDDRAVDSPGGGPPVEGPNDVDPQKKGTPPIHMVNEFTYWYALVRVVVATVLPFPHLSVPLGTGGSSQ
jgi:hypothetical protein